MEKIHETLNNLVSGINEMKNSLNYKKFINILKTLGGNKVKLS